MHFEHAVVPGDLVLEVAVDELCDLLGAVDHIGAVGVDRSSLLLGGGIWPGGSEMTWSSVEREWGGCALNYLVSHSLTDSISCTTSLTHSFT